jgi:hypothetical protein
MIAVMTAPEVAESCVGNVARGGRPVHPISRNKTRTLTGEASRGTPQELLFDDRVGQTRLRPTGVHKNTLSRFRWLATQEWLQELGVASIIAGRVVSTRARSAEALKFPP